MPLKLCTPQAARRGNLAGPSYPHRPQELATVCRASDPTLPPEPSGPAPGGQRPRSIAGPVVRLPREIRAMDRVRWTVIQT
jgi:hypothetical protein